MAKEERQENLEEIKKELEKSLKKNKQLSQEEITKLIEEANENVDFLKTLEEVSISSPSKRVIFVDGKACLVYDNGVFYIEDSTDSTKNKKKLTRQQATELYVEYFFRYIMNPAIEHKKMLEQVQKVAVKSKKALTKKVAQKKIAEKSKDVINDTKSQEIKHKVTKSKEEYIR